MKCKYNRAHLKIPNSCLEGLQRCVDTVRRGSTHHLRVGHRTKAGHKYICLDLRHVLCWERREEEYRKGPTEGGNVETFALIEQGTKQDTDAMFVFCLEIFLPTGEQLVPRLKGHTVILTSVASIDIQSKSDNDALPPAMMKPMKARIGSVLC